MPSPSTIRSSVVCPSVILSSSPFTSVFFHPPQKLLPPASACQLQQVKPDKDMVLVGAQDIAITGILFCSWQQVCKCENSKQPTHLKVVKISRIIRQQWDQCGLRLCAGMHVKERANGGYILDGKSLLRMVTRYRANTKKRKGFSAYLQRELHGYYDELPQPYRPADYNTPLHVHWINAKSVFRPSKKRKRPPVRKKPEEIVLHPAQM